MDHIRVARLFGKTLLMKPHLVSVYKRWVVIKMCPVEHCWLRLAVLEMNDKPVNSALNEALHWRRLWSSSRLHRRQWERWYIWQNSAFWKARAARIPWHCKSKVKDDAPDYCVSSRKQKCPKAQWNLSLNPKTVTLPKSSWNTLLKSDAVHLLYLIQPALAWSWLGVAVHWLLQYHIWLRWRDSFTKGYGHKNPWQGIFCYRGIKLVGKGIRRFKGWACEAAREQWEWRVLHWLVLG